jgi:N-acetylglutamate synthase-like GNAT family acetyltransferase
MTDSFIIRPARADEEPIIKAMIRHEQLDPLNVHWQSFLVATEGDRIIGIGQVKPYRSGRELGSLAVAADRRQRGVGGAIINALIARENGPLLLFCLSFREPFYAKFGFRRVDVSDLPGELKLKYVVGRLFTSVMKYRVIAMKRPASVPGAGSPTDGLPEA